MRAAALALAAALLAGCAPPYTGVAPPPLDPFGRDAQLERGIVRTPTPIRPPQVPATAGPVEPVGGPVTIVPPATDPEVLAAETRAILGAPPAEAVLVDPLPSQVVTVSPGAIDPSLDRDNAAISTEQDFGAVAEQRSIEDDAERLRRARERFEVVAPPTDLSRPDDAAPDVVGYALRRAQPVGTAAYGRSLLASESRSSRRCASFGNADAAQEAFLAAGGPERDPQGLDPDGDGNACRWDPATYRALLGRGE